MDLTEARTDSKQTVLSYWVPDGWLDQPAAWLNRQQRECIQQNVGGDGVLAFGRCAGVVAMASPLRKGVTKQASKQARKSASKATK